MFSVALRDVICPPSTVFAAYNHYGSATDADPAREMVVYPYNNHEGGGPAQQRSEEHTSELQSRGHLVCRLLLEKKKKSMILYHMGTLFQLRIAPGSTL